MPGEKPRFAFYDDAERRYRNDVAFRATVDLLEAVARNHGYTPGELKQIAFKAALNLEMKAVRAMRLDPATGELLPLETKG